MKVISRASNQRNYRIIKKYFAGLVLTGSEIKSLRLHQVSLAGSFVLPQKNELYVHNMYVAPYRNSCPVSVQKKYDARQSRKLLLKRAEIAYLVRQTKIKHYVLIVIQLFINEKGWAKLEIALAQPLKKFQTKGELKEKEIKKKLQRKEYY